MLTQLDIATAGSRHQKTWRNEQMTWDKLVTRLERTHRTAETYATYISSPKPRQAEIKDIGGFVGGYLLEGIRGKGHVKHRQVLALDIDFGYPEFWEDYTTYFINASLVYSTHAHSMVSPRFRLIIPLTRPVSVEEYEAVSRKIAGTLGTQYFDKTTFQAERLMYWPSTAKDGDYYFRKQDGPWLNPDTILGEYRDWRQVSEWPLCPTETDIVKSEVKKQEDPLEKDGVIGAFCRTYSIREAIAAFLPDDYAEADGDRFTYLGGTTAAGAICYDDKFLYSHHSTDPICGMLVNAFDLVRIHKYGAQDLDTTIPASKRPSFQAMSNLARTDANVIHELGIFKLDLPEGEDTEWLKLLELSKKGDYNVTIDNFAVILRNDPALKGKFSLNEFDHRLYSGDKEITDDDESEIRHHIEKDYGMYHTAKCRDAFGIVCQDNSFHPVKDYLNSLSWDGVARLDKLFIDQLGVPDTPYTRAATRKSLVAAVARVFEPGIKFDYMVVMIGSQGKGKSSLLHDLGKDWFSDTLDSVTGKEAYMQIQGAWLIEMAELSSIKKAEVEAVKNFISKREDRFRVPFAKHNASFKRQSVFFGSTNEFTFLIDKTGNRRFWPLIVTRKYVPGSIDPDPIWAEALYYYKEGERLYLSDEMEAMAAEQQMVHTEVDERAGLIEAFVDMQLPEDWDERATFERVSFISANDGSGTVRRDRVCAAEVWCELLNNKFPDMSAYNTKFIHAVLGNLPGWVRTGTLSYRKYGNQRSYVRVGGKYFKEEMLETNKDNLNNN